MADEEFELGENEEPLFSSYGEFHVLLDAKPRVLAEAFIDCSEEQLEKCKSIINDQLVDLRHDAQNVDESPKQHILRNEELYKRHALVHELARATLEYRRSDEE